MKKFLITTMLGIATTAAFGAASLRAPQIGGTATVATPTTNTARAGTLRTQTTKTTSISTPASVTTTQSITTPVSTETTDARLSLLKGIKGVNPGKIKDTTAATNELNSLNDRIEELTAQLDRAEAAQSSVITEANIDAKIDQKLSQIGTSTASTYSKTEINNLLTALERKLPQIDDRGNINMIDPTNGSVIAWSPYQYIRTTQAPVVDMMEYNNSSLPNSEQSLEKIRNWARGRCQKLTQSQNTQNVEPRQILDCGLQQATYQNGSWNILVAVVYKGYAEYQDPGMGVTSGGVVYVKYLESIEYDTEEKFETAACNGRDADNCYVQSFAEGGFGALTYIPAHRATVIYVYNYKGESNTALTLDDNGNLNITDSNGATIAQLLPYNLYSTYKYNDLASTQTYKLIVPHDFKTSSFGGLAQDYTRDWVSDICATERSNPDLVACGFYNADGKNTAMTEFSTISCFKGMHKINSSVTDDMVNVQYTTFEDLNETQIHDHFCGDASSDECSISGYTKTPMGACTEKTFIVKAPQKPSNDGVSIYTCPEGCTLKIQESSIQGGNWILYCWNDNTNKLCDGPFEQQGIVVTPLGPDQQ